jgi:hypothetical protein
MGGPSPLRPVSVVHPFLEAWKAHMQNDVVAHYLNGNIVKGTSMDVAPGKGFCHIKTEEGLSKVEFKDLKALYFVKTLEGNSGRKDTQEVEEDDIRLRGSRLLEVVFKDGERLVVLCNSFPPKTERFFVLPVDMDSNNERILVNRDAIVSITEVES